MCTCSTTNGARLKYSRPTAQLRDAEAYNVAKNKWIATLGSACPSKKRFYAIKEIIGLTFKSLIVFKLFNMRVR